MTLPRSENDEPAGSEPAIEPATEERERQSMVTTRRISRALADGLQFGKYRIVRLIGIGGMSEIYEAIHIGLRKRVALKAMRRDLAESPEARQRFIAEGINAARIRHTNVVDVTDVGEVDELPFLVMNLLEGEDLGRVFDRQGRIPVAEIVDLLLPVAAAVALGHEKGVVHRDLKPDNIYLHREGFRVIPKVLDFGVSRVLNARRITLNSSVFGTPHYMSPEQARGGATDARTDQYSLGVILYEGVTGTLPRDSNNPIELLHAVAYDGFRPPSDHFALAPELEAVILRAMAHDPEQRFASMRELAMALVPFASESAREYWSIELGLISADRISETRLPQTVRHPSPIPRAIPPLDPADQTGPVPRRSAELAVAAPPAPRRLLPPPPPPPKSFGQRTRAVPREPEPRITAQFAQPAMGQPAPGRTAQFAQQPTMGRPTSRIPSQFARPATERHAPGAAQDLQPTAASSAQPAQVTLARLAAERPAEIVEARVVQSNAAQPDSIVVGPPVHADDAESNEAHYEHLDDAHYSQTDDARAKSDEAEDPPPAPTPESRTPPGSTQLATSQHARLATTSSSTQLATSQHARLATTPSSTQLATSQHARLATTPSSTQLATSQHAHPAATPSSTQLATSQHALPAATSIREAPQAIRHGRLEQDSRGPIEVDGHALRKPRRRERMAWLLAAVLPLVAVGGLWIWKRDPRSTHTTATAPKAGDYFEVDVQANPPNAELRLNGKPVAVGRYSTRLKRDGTEHELTASAEGWNSASVRFRDHAPPKDLQLAREPQPTAAAIEPVATNAAAVPATAAAPAKVAKTPAARPVSITAPAVAAEPTAPPAISATEPPFAAGPQPTKADRIDSVDATEAALPKLGIVDAPAGNPRVAVVDPERPNVRLVDEDEPKIQLVE